MENNTPDPLQMLLTKWQALTLSKKVIAAVLGLISAFIVWSLLMTLLNNFSVRSTGLSGYDTSYEGIPTRSESARLAPLPQPDGGYTPGIDAENFETRDYYVAIETRDLDYTCGVIESLKPQPSIVFTTAQKSQRACSYGFKVKNAEAESVLGLINELNPEELRQNINTIKKQIEDNLNERDILNQNLTAVEQILSEALVAYDNLLVVATGANNAEALATAIRDKIAIIDQLKQRREQTRQQIDYLNRNLAEQQDRLEYTYFSVAITEQKYVDGEALKNSWQYELRSFVTTANDTLQQLSIGLLAFILKVVSFAIYGLLLLLALKLGWRVVRAVWKA